MTDGRKKKGTRSKPAMDLIEEAIGLLREAPGSLAAYYVGTVPFLLSLLFYCADMAHSAFAYEYSTERAAGVAVSFIWMKCWQAVFMSSLKDRCMGPATRGQQKWSVRRIMRIAIVQAAIQPSALFLRPLALLVALPYAWVRAFYEYAILYGDGTGSGVRDVIQRSMRQAKLWPSQNHLLLSWLTLTACFVWINVFTGMAVIPWLLKVLLGIETPFSRSIYTVLNSTFLGISIAGTYMVTNPLTKACYVLRCFYGESLRTGDDLRIEISKWRATAVGLTTAALLLLVSIPARAQTPSPGAQTTEAIPPPNIDHSIDKTFQRREYAWRLPRKLPQEAAGKKGWFARWIDGAIHTISKWGKKVREWTQTIFEWIFKRLPKSRPKPEESTGEWGSLLRPLALGLTAIGAVLIGFLIYRRWRSGRNPAVEAVALPATPDLNAEDISAAQLPEDGWLRLAREMEGKGELRLALRALYLAGLAHLGARNLVNLARHKSNRDYDVELARRAKDQASLLDAFRSTVLEFERAWYGLHAVEPGTIAAAETNLERLRTE